MTTGRSRDILISQILNTAPFQLPPVIHGHGVYSLDIYYMGESFSKIGVSLEEVLEAYYDFVTKFNFKKSPRPEMADVPVRPGTKVYPTERPWTKTG